MITNIWLFNLVFFVLPKNRKKNNYIINIFLFPFGKNIKQNTNYVQDQKEKEL
jgi:hypothetical protein